MFNKKPSFHRNLTPIKIVDHLSGREILVAGNPMNYPGYRKSFYCKMISRLALLCIIIVSSFMVISQTTEHVVASSPLCQHEEYISHVIMEEKLPSLSEILIGQIEFTIHEYECEDIVQLTDEEMLNGYQYNPTTFYLPEIIIPALPFSQIQFTSTYTDNIAIAWNFFISRGVSPEATAGIVGTLIRETTTINPMLVNHGDNPRAKNHPDSIGIGQWNGYRALALRRQSNWQSLYVQLEFMWNEMQTSDINMRMRGSDAVGNPLGMRNINNRNTSPLYGGFMEFIHLRCVDHAARLFDAAYTRSGDTSANGRIYRRVRYSIQVFERFQEEYYASLYYGGYEI